MADERIDAARVLELDAKITERSAYRVALEARRGYLQERLDKLIAQRTWLASGGNRHVSSLIDEAARLQCEIDLMPQFVGVVEKQIQEFTNERKTLTKTKKGDPTNA